MTTKHTPGPWRIAGDQGVQIRSERDQIAKVWTMRGNEWKANARLIASAPELLEALQLVASLEVEPGVILTGPELALTVSIVQQAIAKATGGDN